MTDGSFNSIYFKYQEVMMNWPKPCDNDRDIVYLIFKSIFTLLDIL
jgi:hypothetical protein